MTPEFHRIRRLPPYVFEEVNRIKARLRAEGVDIIDFGMGNPDMPTPKHIVDKLVETARDPKAGRYSASRPTCSRRSIVSRPACAARAWISSTSAWAIPTCRRPSISLTS